MGEGSYNTLFSPVSGDVTAFLRMLLFSQVEQEIK